MTIQSRVQEIVFKAIEESNRQMPPDSHIEIALDTALYGESGKLDSLGLVSLILEVELGIEEELGKVLVLADEKAFSRTSSPFRTVGTLTNYIAELLDEEHHLD